MAHPKDFIGVCGVVNISIMVEALLYWYIGFFGYYVYRSDTKSHIFLNLPKNDV
jgi:amino acid permease